MALGYGWRLLGGIHLGAARSLTPQTLKYGGER
jgi:hypothetical protein